MSSTIAINADIEPEIRAETYQGPLLDDRGLFKRLFNAQTQDFLAGAAIVGSLSYATRIGVLSAATAAGVGALPAVLAAGATTGLVTGSIRFYREYKKARYDLNDPEVHKIFYRQLLMSTALSTLGGGMGYAFVNHYDAIAELAQKTGVPAWIGGNLTALANSPVGIAVADIAAPVKTAVVEAYDWARPSIAAMVESGKVFASRVYDSLPDGVSAGIESAAQSVKGWWKSAMSAVGLSQSVPVAQAATPPAADNDMTFADRFVGGNNVSVVEQTVEPSASEMPPVDKLDMDLPNRHVVHTLKITPEGVSVPDATLSQAPVEMEIQEPVVSAPVAEQTVTIEKPAAPQPVATQTAETPVYVQDYLEGITPAIKQPVPSFAGLDFVTTENGLTLPEFDTNSTPKYLPKLAEKFTIHSWDSRFDDLASGVTPENVTEVFAELDETSFERRYPTGVFDKVFPDRAAEIAAKAASGELHAQGLPVQDLPVQDLPVQKDIAAVVPSEPVPAIVPPSAPGSVKEQIGSYFEGKHLSRHAARVMEKAMSGDLQGQKDLAMNLLHGKGGFQQDSAMAMKLYDNVIAQGSVEGKLPRGAVFQAIRDKAWVQFYGYGDVPADQEAAKSAISKLAEFNSGARRMLREWTGEKVRHVAEASKHAVASVHENVTKKMPGRLSCNFMKVDNTVVSGTCKGGALGLKVGDKITLNP